MSIDLSLANIWKSWYLFKKKKKRTKELEYFEYFLERNLFKLYFQLNNEKYFHEKYNKFIIKDNKRREVFNASISDKIVHRLLYEYLNSIYEKTFIFDVFSCRKKKGLNKAIERTQSFLRKNPNSFIWRADIKKFFDNVDHKLLIKILYYKVKDKKALFLLKKIIYSYSVSKKKGIPIGNLTSQIFANIYLHELDRFIKHIIKPNAYLRYGDDFIIIFPSFSQINKARLNIKEFLEKKLFLAINYKNDIIIKEKQGLKFLGAEIFFKGKRINKRNLKRVCTRLNFKNISSYSGLINYYNKNKNKEFFNWLILEKIEKYDI